MATGSYFFLPTDLVSDTATPTVETGTAATGYEPAYLIDFSDANRQRPAKLTTTTGAWLLDFGSAQRVDFVVLWHNFDAALANVKIQMNATNSWGGPTMSATVVPPAKLGDGSTVKIFQDMRTVSGYSTGGFRYLRVALSTANSVNLGLKVLAFSGVRSLARQVKNGLLQPKSRPVISLDTDFERGAWTYDLQVGIRKFLGDVYVDATDRAAIQFWHDACGGRATLTTLVPEPDDVTQGVMVGRWTGDGDGLIDSTLDLERDAPRYARMKLQFEEVTAGGPEWA